MKIFLSLLLLYSNSHAFFFLLLLPSFNKGSNKNQQIEKYSLNFDLGKFKDAKIVIRNIKEPYIPGMTLKKGNYDIEISRTGYSSIIKTIKLNKNSDYKVLFTLDTEYFKSECNKGDAESCFNLGLAYNNGLDQIQKNFIEAVKYYEIGCGLNESNSCLGLAVMNYYGQGVFQNTNKAKQYLQKACNLGNTNACSNINKLN